MNKPNYTIEQQNEKCIVIRDIGPWDHYPSITNGAEEVVAELAEALNGRRLFYYDSEGSLDELVIEDNKFHSFAPGPGDLNWS